MRPGWFPLELYRGDSFAWSFHVWSDCEGTVASDLTGATAAAQIRDAPDGATVLELECVVTLPNVVDVALPSIAWAAPIRSGAWDLELTWPDGRVFTLVAGPVLVVTDVTVAP